MIVELAEIIYFSRYVSKPPTNSINLGWVRNNHLKDCEHSIPPRKVKVN
jgi:hypothetical protein